MPSLHPVVKLTPSACFVEIESNRIESNRIESNRIEYCACIVFRRQVVAGDEADPKRPGDMGSSVLREHCDETLLERSFALQFRERSLEVNEPGRTLQTVNEYKQV